jgi:hypothetical protein
VSDQVHGGGFIGRMPETRSARELYAGFIAKDQQVLAIATPAGDVIIDWSLVEKTAKMSIKVASEDCIAQARLLLAARDGTWVAP